MPLIPVQIPPGVVRGATPYETPGRWYDMNLCRWRQGVLEPLGGWVLQGATGLPFSSRVRRMHRWRDNGAFLRTVVFTDTGVWAYDGEDYIDITPQGPFTAEFTAEFQGAATIDFTTAGGLPIGYSVGPYGAEAYGTARSEPSELLSATVPMWGFDNWGEDLVAVASPNGELYYWDVTNSNDPMTIVNAAPSGSRSVIVTEERHVVLLQPGGEKRRVAWSSREDYEDWDFTSTTNTAGFKDLESRTGIVTAEHSRNGTLIFTETEVFSMRFIGSPFIYGFEMLEETRLIGPRAVTHDSGVAFWWSRDGFFKSDGTQVEPIPCPIWNYLQSCLCQTTAPSLVHASDHGWLPEIWWFYPTQGSTVSDQYVIYNWLENHWSIGTLTRTAMMPALGDKPPVMADANGYLYDHETGWTAAGASRDGTIYAETSAIRLPSAGENNIEVKQAMIANELSTDSLRVTFYTRQTPMGSERTFGPYSPRSDGYIDTRVTGRDVRIKVEALGDTDWTLGEMRFDVSAGARR